MLCERKKLTRLYMCQILSKHVKGKISKREKENRGEGNLNITVNSASKSAIEAVEKAGGKVTIA